MSADKWTTCPNCEVRHSRELYDAEKELERALAADKHHSQVDMLQKTVDRLEAVTLKETLRWDYELYNPVALDPRTFSVDFRLSLQCDVCGYSLQRKMVVWPE